MDHELTVTHAATSRCSCTPTRRGWRRSIGNLLNNACKFTDKGGHIWLTVEQDGDEAVIRVRDNGIGIARRICRASSRCSRRSTRRSSARAAGSASA